MAFHSHKNYIFLSCGGWKHVHIRGNHGHLGEIFFWEKLSNTEALRSLEPVLREDFAGGLVGVLAAWGIFFLDHRAIDASMGVCLSISSKLYTCRLPSMIKYVCIYIYMYTVFPFIWLIWIAYTYSNIVNRYVTYIYIYVYKYIFGYSICSHPSFLIFTFVYLHMYTFTVFICILQQVPSTNCTKNSNLPHAIRRGTWHPRSQVRTPGVAPLTERDDEWRCL